MIFSMAPLELDSPSLSFTDAAECIIEARSGNDYSWFIDDEEKVHLSEILGFDFRGTGLDRVLIDGPKQKCRGCGKYTGLDDLVYNALEDGIHNKELMIKVFETKTPHAGSPHELRCSGAGCGMVHVEKRSWGTKWLGVEPDEQA